MKTTFFNRSLLRTFTWNALAAAALWLPTASAAQPDVTQPDDPIELVNGVNDGDAAAGPPPPPEGVEHAIDNVGQKYLNFLDLGSGFAVQPAVGLTLVSGLRLYTANDAQERDPASYLLEGSTNGLAGPWTTIASGPLSLPAGRNPGGAAPLGSFFQEVAFSNSTACAAYRLTFPTLKNAGVANSMQIGEVEFLGMLTSPRILSQPASQSVLEGATASFTVIADGAPPLTYQWLFNEANPIAGATNNTLVLSNVQIADVGGYSVLVSSTLGSVTSAVATLQVGQIRPLSEAVDAPGLVWTTGGTALWYGQTVVTHDGDDAAESGDIADGQESWLETTVTGPGLLSSWWKVSSAGSGFLEFYVNGLLEQWIGGTQDWRQLSMALPSGPQTLRWRYVKDAFGSAGQDRGWVDAVSIGPDFRPSQILSQPASQSVPPGASATFAVIADGAPPLAYQWYFGVNAIAGATNNTLDLDNVQLADAGDYTVVVTNAFGSTTSSNAWLAIAATSQFCADFNPAFPSGMTLFGSARVDGGYLQLTPAANQQFGVAYIDDFCWGRPIRAFRATFNAMLFGSSTLDPADGFSFNLVPVAELNPGPGYAHYEEGLAAGLAVNFDTWDSGQGEAPAIEVKWRGTLIDRRLYQASQSPGGITDPVAAAKEVEINLDSDGTLDVRYGDNALFGNLPTPYTPVAGAQWVIAARTGGYNDNHWFDDVCLEATWALLPGPVQFVAGGEPADLSVNRDDPFSFRAAIDGTPPYSAQWYQDDMPIPGATNISYGGVATPALDGARFRVSVSNQLGGVLSTNATLTVIPVAVRIWGSGQTVPARLGPVVAIAAGLNHSLALRTDGTVVAWGVNFLGQIDVPASLTNVVAIAAGGNHSLALMEDGTVVAWGANFDGQTSVPPSLTNGVAIAAGGNHSLALRTDGTVLAWGRNWSGQTDVPAGLRNAVAIAGSWNNSVALRADGTVAVWGYNFDGQTNLPVGLTNVVAIAGGGNHLLALRANGTVVVWGDNSYGQTDVPAGLTGVVAIAGGAYHSLALIGEEMPFYLGTPSRVMDQGGNFQIPLLTRRGKAYRLEYKDSLTVPTWRLLPPLPGDGTQKTLTDRAPLAPQRFYRVRAL